MSTYKDQFEKAKKSGKCETVTAGIKQWEEEGDELYGKLIKIEPFQGGQYAGEVMRYIFETDNGVVSTILGKGADNQLNGADVTGKILHIKFLGKGVTREGHPVNRFEIEAC